MVLATKPRQPLKNTANGGTSSGGGTITQDGPKPPTKPTPVQKAAEAAKKSEPAKKPPAAKAPKEPKAAKPPANKSASNGTPRFNKSSVIDKKIELLTKDNPKRAGSRAHRIYELYKTHKTAKSFLEAGGRVSALKYDSNHGFIKLID